MGLKCIISYFTGKSYPSHPYINVIILNRMYPIDHRPPTQLLLSCTCPICITTKENQNQVLERYQGTAFHKFGITGKLSEKVKAIDYS